MKTVWILTWEFAGQGKYGKLISGVFANKKDASKERFSWNRYRND